MVYTGKPTNQRINDILGGKKLTLHSMCNSLKEKKIKIKSRLHSSFLLFDKIKSPKEKK